jgi:hypothetical protein
MKTFLLLFTAAVLLGCQTQHSRTAKQFEFLQGGMQMTAVTNRVGLPDRELGSGQLRWEYDLSDGSQLIILPQIGDYENLATWQVAWFGQRRGTNWLWTKPEDYK